ncbi:hypothetical protein P4647_06270 [Peribacillus frigoritolerans]|uniref:hypothetical protein n=1 Tax=Peribacillus TaxID=2675229 RepID=UPI002E1F9A36|nr:hypothetical protein [Peribacillus frigoritolerans]
MVFLWFVHLAVDWNVRDSLSLQVHERILSSIQIILGDGIRLFHSGSLPNPNEAEKDASVRANCPAPLS